MVEIKGHIMLFIFNVLCFLVVIVAANNTASTYYECDVIKTCVYKNPFLGKTQLFDRDKCVMPESRNNELISNMVKRKRSDRKYTIRIKDRSTKPKIKTSSTTNAERSKLDLNTSIFQVLEKEFKLRIKDIYKGKKDQNNRCKNQIISISNNENISDWIHYKNYSKLDWKSSNSNNLDYGFPNIQKELDKIKENNHIPSIIIEIGGENHQYDDDSFFVCGKNKINEKYDQRSIHDLHDPMVNIGTISKPYTLYLLIFLILL